MGANHRVETSRDVAVARYIPGPARIGLHLGTIVLASLTFWLAFFWFGPISMILPEEGAAELATADVNRVRLLFGTLTAMPTVIIAILGYWIWLIRRLSRGCREVMESARQQTDQGGD